MGALLRYVWGTRQRSSYLYGLGRGCIGAKAGPVPEGQRVPVVEFPEGYWERRKDMRKPENRITVHDTHPLIRTKTPTSYQVGSPNPDGRTPGWQLLTDRVALKVARWLAEAGKQRPPVVTVRAYTEKTAGRAGEVAMEESAAPGVRWNISSVAIEKGLAAVRSKGWPWEECARRPQKPSNSPQDTSLYLTQCGSMSHAYKAVPQLNSMLWKHANKCVDGTHLESSGRAQGIWGAALGRGREPPHGRSIPDPAPPPAARACAFPLDGERVSAPHGAPPVRRGIR